MATSQPEDSSPKYRICLRNGPVELDISGPDRTWVESKLEELEGWLKQAPGTEPSSASKVPSLAEHVRAVGPSGGLEHVLAVGYYLERHSRLKGGFRRRDVAEAFSAIRYRHSNPGVPIAAARRRGLLMDGEEHEKVQLTETAERWVEERLGSRGDEPEDP